MPREVAARGPQVQHAEPRRDVGGRQNPRFLPCPAPGLERRAVIAGELDRSDRRGRPEPGVAPERLREACGYRQRDKALGPQRQVCRNERRTRRRVHEDQHGGELAGRPDDDADHAGLTRLPVGRVTRPQGKEVTERNRGFPLFV